MEKNAAGATSGLATVPQHGVLWHLGARRVVPGIIINVMIMMILMIMMMIMMMMMMMMVMMLIMIMMRYIINLSFSVLCNLRRRNPAEVRLSFGNFH